ncbi:UDP-N-acetylmuramoyl-tripeptide--D-alanyl-D-alanine ligase [Falsibacillus pallidus]|uniref:UDP-N-acetylmuramoyl-tripeptide--D-alanyl-D- alanine ligase n=1 Tax=Falsibacillus pallidus TaxID=493781 RepID=UPI003D99DAEE
MIKRSIKQLSEMFQFDQKILDAFGDTEIQGVCIDTRKLQKGNLFIPFKGEKIDGHTLVKDAFEKGASAALWEKDVPNPPQDVPVLLVDSSMEAVQELSKSYRNQLDLKVVGVTGSNGKTTTKDMIAAVLGTGFKVQKTEGNYNNHLGLPLTLLSIEEDTKAVVLEMGMSARGEIEFLTKLARPDIAVITNIGESHLQDLGSREGIAEAKLEIALGLGEEGTLVYFGDEPLLQERLQGCRPYQLQSFGQSENNDVYPVEVNSTEDGNHFRVNINPDIEFFVPVMGIHNVMNAVSAVIVGSKLGLDLEKIKTGLAGLKLTAMRMEKVAGINGSVIINDAYNASPTSMRAAIRLAEEQTGSGKKYLVLGDMLELGDKEKEFHLQTGREIDPEKITEVFTYGERGMWIAEGARERFGEERVHALLDKEPLIEALKSKVNEKDFILVKASRGMKLEDIVHALESK